MKSSSDQIGETQYIHWISARLRCGAAARWWASDCTHVLRTAHSSSVRREVRETFKGHSTFVKFCLNVAGVRSMGEWAGRVERASLTEAILTRSIWAHQCGEARHFLAPHTEQDNLRTSSHE